MRQKWSRGETASKVETSYFRWPACRALIHTMHTVHLLVRQTPGQRTLVIYSTSELPLLSVKFITSAHCCICFKNDLKLVRDNIFCPWAHVRSLQHSSCWLSCKWSSPNRALAGLACSLLQSICLGNAPVWRYVCMFELPVGLLVSIWVC